MTVQERIDYVNSSILNKTGISEFIIGDDVDFDVNEEYNFLINCNIGDHIPVFTLLSVMSSHEVPFKDQFKSHKEYIDFLLENVIYEMIERNRVIKKYYFKKGQANETKSNWDSDIDAGRDIGCVEYWSGCDIDVIKDMLRHAATSDQPAGRDKQATNRTNRDN